MNRGFGAACRRGGALALAGLVSFWASGLLLCLLACLLVLALGLVALCGVVGLGALALLPRESRMALRQMRHLLTRLAEDSTIATLAGATSMRK